MYLKKLNSEDVNAQYLLFRDIPENINGYTNEFHGCSLEDYKCSVLPKLKAWENGVGLPEGYVPETYYYFWVDDNIAGEVRIRHHLCESLVNGSGHIGYYLAPAFRGKGLGVKLLEMAVIKASKIIPENEIYLRVEKSNAPSLKCMLKIGGYIHHEDEEHYYVRIKKLSKEDMYGRDQEQA